MKTTLISMIIGALMSATPASAAPADGVFPRGLPHAPKEGTCYTYRCVWDGKHQGDGKGRSLILTRWRDGYVGQPISHRRAHRLQAAYCERRNVTCRGYDD